MLMYTIQVFVETLDRCFENVCELDLIFHVDRVQNILQETCMGGMVLETNMSEILTHVEAQNKLEKSESSPTSSIRVRICIYATVNFWVLVQIFLVRSDSAQFSIQNSKFSPKRSFPFKTLNSHQNLHMCWFEPEYLEK